MNLSDDLNSTYTWGQYRQSEVPLLSWLFPKHYNSDMNGFEAKLFDQMAAHQKFDAAAKFCSF